VQKEILPPNPSRLIEGLRDTGYDFNTALADVIDNSVDAGASEILVSVDMDPEGDVVISVADDGCGMNRKSLLNGMTYGAPGHADPKRLGKFGLGLKTASTAFCRRLSVISRDSGTATPLKAIWDLDHVENVGDWELLLDSPTKEDIALLNRAAAGRPGTVVVWDKVDRLLKTYSDPGGGHARNALGRAIDSFRDHASMVYQRFLDPGDSRARTITMKINGVGIKPWSPFCEDEPETELVAEDTREVEMADGESATFRIRAFVLPRREHFSSPEAATRAKIKNQNQGIYIYRENRLIHPSDWLGMFAKEPHVTLLRVEFSFDHALDAAFHVDIKKSRILLNEALYDWVLNQFLPAPRNAATERYRKGQRKDAEKQSKDAHLGSNAIIGDKESDLTLAKVKVTDAANNEVQIKNKMGEVRLKLKIGSASPNGQIYVQTVDGIDDGLLWEPALVSGHHSVRINTGHPYYHKVYVPNHTSGVTIQGMDALLWALVEAELGTVSEKTKNHLQELRFEVSRLLRKLVEDLPEPEIEVGEIA
jgi:hypothetical protein